MYILAYWTGLLLAVDHVQTIGMYLDPAPAYTFYDAVDRCIHRGMELAILNTQAKYEEAAVYIKSVSLDITDVWIGYKIKDVTTKQFEWINGQTMQYNTPWGPYDPNDIAADCCVRLFYRDGVIEFADISCYRTHAFLCTDKEEITTTEVLVTATDTMDTTKTIRLTSEIADTSTDKVESTEAWVTTVHTIDTSETNTLTGEADESSASDPGETATTALISEGTNVTIADTRCVCQCSNVEILQNYKNDTFEELKKVLAPVTDQLRKELLVDKQTISAYIYKRKTREDNRPSAKYLGYVGGIILIAIGVIIILADLSSCCTK